MDFIELYPIKVVFGVAGGSGVRRNMSLLNSYFWMFLEVGGQEKHAQ